MRDKIDTCPFCKFPRWQWEDGHPDIYASDWEYYAPFKTTILGHEAIECANCGIVVIETTGADPLDEWNHLSQAVVK